MPTTRARNSTSPSKRSSKVNGRISPKRQGHRTNTLVADGIPNPRGTSHLVVVRSKLPASALSSQYYRGPDAAVAAERLILITLVVLLFALVPMMLQEMDIVFDTMSGKQVAPPPPPKELLPQIAHIWTKFVQLFY